MHPISLVLQGSGWNDFGHVPGQRQGVFLAPRVQARAMAAVPHRTRSQPEVLSPFPQRASHVYRAEVKDGLLLYSFRRLLTATASLARAEMMYCLGKLVRRFECQLYDVVRERDIDVHRDCFLGEPSKDTKGVRLLVTKDVAGDDKRRS
jgi:hypothetical protein